MTDKQRAFIAMVREDFAKSSVFERAGIDAGILPTEADIREVTRKTIEAVREANLLPEEKEPLLLQLNRIEKEALLELARIHQVQSPAPVQSKVMQRSETPAPARVHSAAPDSAGQPYHDLISQLKGGDPERAVKNLAKIGEPVVGPLIQALSEQDYHYSDAIKKALEAIGEPAVIPLIHALNDESPTIREKAAIVLGRMRDSCAVEALIQASKDSEDSVRSFSGWALGQIGDPRAIDPLIRILDFNDPNNYAADALVKIGEPAVEPLIQALTDPNAVVRSYVAFSLGQIGDQRAVQGLIKALNDQNDVVRSEAAHALGRIGDPSAIEPLSRALEDTHRDVRSAAAVALGLKGDSRVLEPLCQLLQDPSPLRRGAAAEALGNIRVRRAVEALIQALSDPYMDVRAKAVVSLGQIADSCAVEPLTQVLKDNSVTVQQYAADALVKIGDPTTQALKMASKNRNYYIRKDAEKEVVEVRVELRKSGRWVIYTRVWPTGREESWQWVENEGFWAKIKKFFE